LFFLLGLMPGGVMIEELEKVWSKVES